MVGKLVTQSGDSDREKTLTPSYHLTVRADSIHGSLKDEIMDIMGTTGALSNDDAHFV